MAGIFYTGEVGGCLAEVSVTEQILRNFQIPRNPGGTEHAQTVCTRLFSPRPRTILGTRLGATHACTVSKDSFHPVES